jgi:hypothetical protein
VVSGNNAAGIQLVDCIIESNGGVGFKINGNSSQYRLINCDVYNNGSDGVLDGIGGGLVEAYIENCNFVKNGGYGVNLVGGDTLYAVLVNNGFGAGTQANTSGQTNITTGTDVVEVSGSVTYANDVTPWVDPANGDFRINLAAAKRHRARRVHANGVELRRRNRLPRHRLQPASRRWRHLRPHRPHHHVHRAWRSLLTKDF